MRRRSFIAFVVGAAATWPIGTRAPEAQRIRKIGYLSGGSSSPFEKLFEAGLGDLGWVRDQNLTIEYRRAEGKPEGSLGLLTNSST